MSATRTRPRGHPTALPPLSPHTPVAARLAPNIARVARGADHGRHRHASRPAPALPVTARLRFRPLPHIARQEIWSAIAVATSAVVLAGCAAASAPQPASHAPQRAASPAARATPAASPPTTVTATLAGFRLPVTLSRAVAVPGSAGTLQVLGGLHDGERSTNAVLSVDLASNLVRVVARLPIAVHDSAGGLLAGVPTLLGGGNSSDVAALQQPAGANGSVVGRLPTATSDAVAVATGHGLLLVGGYDGARTSREISRVDSPAHVVRIGSLPVGVRYPAVSVIGSGSAQRVLVIGGESGGVATDVVQQVDPATGAASMLGHLPAPRTQASALRLGGTVFVLGGASSGASDAHTFGDVLRWDPARSRFTTAGQLPYPIADAAAVSPDGSTGYLVGGEGPARVATSILVRSR